LIIVDSSAWIGYFNGADSPAARRLERAIDADERIGVLPLIITEVLQGFRHERDFRRAREILLALPTLTLTVESHVRAAELYRRLRAKGVAVRSTIDSLIAQACLDSDSPLITGDIGDFAAIAKHSRLHLVT
jgi:predicted nucleic acid-binding protein